MCSAFHRFFSAHVSSNALPRFHSRFTRFLPRLSHLPRSLFRIPRNCDQGIAHDRRIAPKVAAVAWYFFPKSCVERILRKNLLFLFCFLHSLIFKSIMDLNMLRLQAFVEGFIYTIQINKPYLLRGHPENKNLFKNLNSLTSQLYKNLLRLTWKNSGSYTRVFTVKALE